MENTVTEENTTTGTLADVVTANDLQGVFTQITALLPIVIPVLVGFIAIRKGISFLTHILHNA